MRQVVMEIMRKYVEELVEEGFTSGALDVRAVVREKMDEMNVGEIIETSHKAIVRATVDETLADVVTEVLDDANLW